MLSKNVTLPDGEDARGNVQGWLQVEKKAHRAMALFGAKNGTALAVLHLLTGRLNRGTNAVIMSHEAIASALGITSRTARDSTKKLEAAKFVQVLKSGTSNVYVINSRVAWQGVEACAMRLSMPTWSWWSRSKTALLTSSSRSQSLQHVPILDFNERFLVGNEDLPPPDQQEMELP